MAVCYGVYGADSGRVPIEKEIIDFFFGVGGSYLIAEEHSHVFHYSGVILGADEIVTNRCILSIGYTLSYGVYSPDIVFNYAVEKVIVLGPYMKYKKKSSISVTLGSPTPNFESISAEDACSILSKILGICGQGAAISIGGRVGNRVSFSMNPVSDLYTKTVVFFSQEFEDVFCPYFVTEYDISAKINENTIFVSYNSITKSIA